MSWVELGRVDAFTSVTFPSPPSEPDVRVSAHPALREFMPSGYATDAGRLDQGVSMLAAR